MDEFIMKPSKYGSKKVVTLDVPYIAKFDTIEVLTAATFTYLREDGYDGIGAGVAQVDTVTLAGESGTANISEAGGLIKLATWNTSLTQTATDFAASHAAAYALVGITVTSSGADIIFTSTLVGMPFDHPVITNVTPDLAGNVVNTTDNETTPLSVH